MNRRSFLKFLGIGTAAAAITPSMLEGFVADPERLLYVPGERTFFLPPAKVMTTYTEAELAALERALGVLRFYDRGTRPRAVSFNRWRPDLSLGQLSDQEVKLAVETGHALAPGMQEAIRRHGEGQDLRALFTSGVHDHGRFTGALYGYGGRGGKTYRMGRTVYQHGQDLVNGPFDPMISTQATDCGIVVIGHKDRKGL
jgi:hypothetical protein